MTNKTKLNLLENVRIRGAERAFAFYLCEAYFQSVVLDSDFKKMITEFQNMLLSLQASITTNAFDNIRSHMGIKDLNDLTTLKNMNKINSLYHKFDTY